MSTPLEGIKVVDLTQHAFGPRAAGFLAEMGADVVKIENAPGGDPARGEDRLRNIPMEGFNAYFEQSNRGKRCIAMNLRNEKARQLAYRLVRQSDVFVTNLRVAALERLGMDHDTLSAMNPRLIYAIGTGWGLRGPARDRGAFEATGMAASGLASSILEPQYRPPLCPPAAGDYTASTFLAYAIMLALFHRERSGEGQMVHVSLLGSMVTIASCCLDVSLVAGQDMFGVPHEADGAFYSCYQTRDNRWIQLALVNDERSWAEFCQAAEVEHLIDDHRFNSAEARRDNNAALGAILDELLLSREYSDWVQRLDGCQFPWAPVRHFTELADDPQMLENGYIVSLDDPQAGRVKVAGVTVELSKTPGSVRGKAPEVGQHTEEVMLELGYTWDDIVQMKEEGAII